MLRAVVIALPSGRCCLSSGVSPVLLSTPSGGEGFEPSFKPARLDGIGQSPGPSSMPLKGSALDTPEQRVMVAYWFIAAKTDKAIYHKKPPVCREHQPNLLTSSLCEETMMPAYW